SSNELAMLLRSAGDRDGRGNNRLSKIEFKRGTWMSRFASRNRRLAYISDVESCFEALKRLREMGVKIAIDDFGTGYSSLSYFRDIPADELKIDQSFVFGLLSDRANAHIVSLIIDLAHRFNLTVVAEGVENRETLEAIKTLGCDVVQGYLYSKPIPADQFKQWLVAFK
ncbi:MAG: EAL domain-containing protein, partial [Candidatus Sedimenticola sp. (ex Thyasira tokunagai)]